MNFLNFFVLFSLILPVSLMAKASTLKVQAKTLLSSQKSIYLSDVVDRKGLSAVMLKSLSKVKLSDAPKKGERRIFTNRAISQVLRKSIKSKGMQFIIPRNIIVENPVANVDKPVVEKRLFKLWKKTCNTCEFEISQLVVPEIPARLRSNKWEIVDDGNIPKGSFNRMIRMQDGENYKNFWISGSVKVKKRVPILKRSLFVGQSVQPDDIEYEVRDITYLGHKVTPKKNQIYGKRLRLGLRSNEIVWLDSLERERAMRRGDLVTVVTDKNSDWSVSLRAVAQQDGFVGDMVKLLNPSTKKLILGRVIGKNKAELQ